jgi:hypothetical protein
MHDAGRRAVARFMAAVNEADRQTLRDAIYCDFNVTAQKQGLIAVVDCIVFQRALESAMAERWGEEAVSAMAKRTMFSAADLAAVAGARVDQRESGDEVVVLPPPHSPMVVRPCSDGEWRVVLRAVHTLVDGSSIEHSAELPPRRLPEQGSREKIEYIRGVGLTLRRTAKAVSDGQFSSPAQASAALQTALDRARSRPPRYDKDLDGPEDETPLK